MKHCTKCNELKLLDEFNKNATHPDGLQAHCKMCVKEQHQKWYQSNKLRVMEQTSNRRKRLVEQIRDMKRELACCKCGEDEAICLDFHHLDPNGKDFSVADMISKGKGQKLILAEIAKCICVCSNCHRKIHGGLIVA